MLQRVQRQLLLAFVVVIMLLGSQIPAQTRRDRKSTRLNSSHSQISYAVFCLKKKKNLVNVLNYTNFHSSLNATATYHDSCAALCECNLKQEPRILLTNIKVLQLVDMNDVETC